MSAEISNVEFLPEVAAIQAFPKKRAGNVNPPNTSCQPANPGVEDSANNDPKVAENRVLWQAGHYAELRTRLTAELICAEATDNQHDLQAIANDLACVYRMQGDTDAAAQFQIQAATREMEQSDDHQLSSTSLSNLACDALVAGNVAVAEGLFWKSLLGELGAGNAAAAASDWANLGLIAGLQGDHAECRYRLWTALKLHRRAGDLLGFGMDLWHLGQSFETTGNWDACRKLFHRAEQTFTQIGHHEFRIAAHKGMELAGAREQVTKFDARRN